MCDMCLEVFAAYTLECEAAAKAMDLKVAPLELFCQETGRVAEMVHYLEKNSERISGSLGTILLCRILDLLQRFGADSAEYDKLLQSAWVRQAIAAECAPDLVSEVLAMNLPFLSGDALWLYQAQTYFSDRKGTQPQLPGLPPTWRLEVLGHLRDWWLKGEGLELNPEALVPGADLRPQERLKFKRLLRLYYLALLQVENTPEERRLLREVVTELPMHSGGLDLWLKRRALACLASWDPLGLPVLEADNRDVLYYYAALKSGMSMEQRAQLAERLETEECLEGAALLRGEILKERIGGMEEWRL